MAYVSDKNSDIVDDVKYQFKKNCLSFCSQKIKSSNGFDCWLRLKQFGVSYLLMLFHMLLFMEHMFHYRIVSVEITKHVSDEQ